MSKKDKNSNSKINIRAVVIISAIGAIALWLAIAAIVGLFSMGRNFKLFPALANGLSDYRVWVFFIGAVGGIVAMFVAREMRSGRRVLKINDIEDSHWLTNADVKANKDMTLTMYSKLSEVSDGVPIYARRQGRDLVVILVSPSHGIIFGNTGSGKTTAFVSPVIQILCRTKTKPSMVITDPKGELNRKHSATLKAQGYNVIVLDVSDTYRSARWNPFAAVIEKTRQIRNAMDIELKADEIIQRSGKYIDMNGVVHATFEQAKQANVLLGQFSFDGKNYATEAEADTARKVFIQELKDEIFVDIQDIIQTICPITDHHQPVWEQGARNFINALALAMWEDLLEGGCPEQAFNLHTLYKNISDYGTEQGITLLDEYLSAGRDTFSQAAGLGATVTSSQSQQLTSYLSTVQNYIVGFADSGIRRLTSDNDIDLNSFDEKPTALFIKIPEEKKNRHFLVSLLITQMYKVLVDKARRNYRNRETKEEELKRTTYFIMDEFGNLPKFESLSALITVGRSRKIFMLPIIQSFSQLDVVYDEKTSKTVRDNANVKIFIGSTDMPTLKEFSELCGKTKQRRISFGDGNSLSSFNVNTSAANEPLVNTSVLERLNNPPHDMGHAIVLAFGKNPLRATFEPFFKAKKLYKPSEQTTDSPPEPQVFDEAAHYYNFAARSLYIARSREFAQKQFADAKKTIEELKDSAIYEPPRPFDPLEGADDRLLPLMVRIKEMLNKQGGKDPRLLAVLLEGAFFDHDVKKLIEVCTTIMDVAKPLNLRWLRSESSKLKNIVKQLAARRPLEVFEGEEYEQLQKHKDED